MHEILGSGRQLPAGGYQVPAWASGHRILFVRDFLTGTIDFERERGGAGSGRARWCWISYETRRSARRGGRSERGRRGDPGPTWDQRAPRRGDRATVRGPGAAGAGWGRRGGAVHPQGNRTAPIIVGMRTADATSGGSSGIDAAAELTLDGLLLRMRPRHPLVRVVVDRIEVSRATIPQPLVERRR